MSRSRRSLAVLVAVALAPLGVAQAAIPNIDLWYGKLKHHPKIIASIDDVRPSKKVDVSLSVTCKDANGQPAGYTLSATAKLKHHRIKVKQSKAYNGVAGTLKLHAKLPVGHAATGSATWKFPASYGPGCSGKGSFKLTYHLSHGG
jgi:hypothetical protein